MAPSPRPASPFSLTPCRSPYSAGLDPSARQLPALLFLLSRGLAAGISIYAPAIVLSTVMGWSLQLTNLAIGGAVILYTVSGGARAVARTQTYQMAVILAGMALAVVFIWRQMPPDLHLS